MEVLWLILRCWGSLMIIGTRVGNNSAGSRVVGSRVVGSIVAGAVARFFGLILFVYTSIGDCFIIYPAHSFSSGGFTLS